MNGGSWVTYTSAIPISADGTHQVEYRSVDNAAHVETTKSLTVKVDKTAPTTASSVSGANVWLNATDATSGVSSVMYRIDNGTWQAYGGMVTITGVGTHTIDFRSTDAAGNQEAVGTVTVVIEDDGGTSSSLSGSLIWIGLIAAVVAALLVLLFVLMRRRKGQQPQQTVLPMGPPAQFVPPPPQQ
jgi:hypothetical protein